MLKTTLATSGTETGLIKLICDFWYCKPDEIVLETNGGVRKNGKLMGCTWARKGKRCCFGY